VDISLSSIWSRHSSQTFHHRRDHLLYESSEIEKSDPLVFIADCFDLAIYILNLPTVDDSCLGNFVR
jgi:hypothetical protein